MDSEHFISTKSKSMRLFTVSNGKIFVLLYAGKIQKVGLVKIQVKLKMTKVLNQYAIVCEWVCKTHIHTHTHTKKA